MDGRTRRPAISGLVVRELWARSAGRCQFRGCNDILYRDDLTGDRSNLGVVSHIVSFRPDGPRGDAVRSPQLATDICNLMLTCRVHGKVIDDKALETRYPEKLLLQFKAEHERRVRSLTDVTEVATTHVLLCQAPIDGQLVQIDESAALRAILPRYAAEERAMVVDLGDVSRGTDTRAFFTVAAESLAKQVESLLRRRPDGHAVNHLSVFALAPVPLLVQLGYLLGDIKHVDLFQKHRDSQNWDWKGEDDDGTYEVAEMGGETDGEIAVVLSISQDVPPQAVKDVLGYGTRILVLRAVDPSLDFLNSRKRLEQFGYECRKVLQKLRIRADPTQTVHLFAAGPSPVAIEFGRNIRRYHPALTLWEYDKETHSYLSALTING